ncbi:TonB-dependent receptor [Sphingosinicella rhizophila]|uniref:TonB-dependent receptor n=1 Tax=Sphingosinicella rhizophila TaxID=3050082 RepID=A0ABU3Q7X5_9SPHN|nr:TonB-dependent receptor [Sphingosinicella sp. GR2756]MDT9599501.1 TonB-dependent receptor [Sphingosinicella sp. GR2756]
MSKSFWLMSAGALAFAIPAHAQDNTSSTGQTSPLQESAEVAQNVDVDSTDEVIVVTAQGREQILQDVPLAVSAVSAEALQNSGGSDIRSLNQLAPSLLVSSTGSEANGSARIRGIGTVGDNPGLESSVAVFIDGVYRSRTGVGLNELGEIERVEVLRGPQGTLFGRNASAGLINIISKKPNLNEFEGFGEATYGNYDHIRIGGGITGPIGEGGLGFRLDGVYVNRDGFLKVVDPQGGTESRVNDRDRLFLRGQLLYEPTDALEIRLIGDYTTRDESCCGAVYIETRETFDPTPATPGDFSVAPSNRIADILRDPFFGETFPSGDDPYRRLISVSPGRTFRNKTEDYGVSLQVDYDLGPAALTSITAYREYKSGGAADLDYGRADIYYRDDDGNSYRQFKTFSQELRLQGSAFDDRLDWLVGGYYAHEDLRLVDNVRFGTQYGAFAACRAIATVNPAAALRQAGAPGCLSPTGRAVLSGQAPGTTPAFGALTPVVLAAVDRLSTVSDVGDVDSRYDQTSENYALFTHNIFEITDGLSLTLGARYTHESKDLETDFNNNNNICPAQQAALAPYITDPNVPASLRTLLGQVVLLTCTGNSSTSLNGLDIRSERDEGEWTGTAVLSYKPNADMMFYASYSKGYKAGGFNLDRSDLGSAIFPRSNADGDALQFAAEKVDAYEIGAKFSGPRGLTFNVAAFRQDFKDFQLNTFNGSVFIVQNVNSCGTDLGGADQDPSATTGGCSADDVEPGVRSQGIEVEMSASPLRNLFVTAGYTYADTKYRRNLIGSSQGEPLDPFLFNLPGKNISNAPKHVLTGSLAFTPELGMGGLSGLFYIDGRYTSSFNTGSDLFPEKAQDDFLLVNARIGIRGPEQRWAVELWAQNLFNKDYQQVAFNSPFQGSGSRAQVEQFGAPLGFGTANQLFSSYLAEPRTYGLTARIRF